VVGGSVGKKSRPPQGPCLLQVVASIFPEEQYSTVQSQQVGGQLSSRPRHVLAWFCQDCPLLRKEGYRSSEPSLVPVSCARCSNFPWEVV
jgi:hypothetical protein